MSILIAAVIGMVALGLVLACCSAAPCTSPIGGALEGFIAGYHAAVARRRNGQRTE
jgi:hypothetical protein